MGRGRVSTKSRKFAFDDLLRKEYRWDIDPQAPLCPFYGISVCPKGRFCRDQHITPPHSHKIVCRHWLRGLCKLGDHCEYLHELDISRVVECPTFHQTGKCPNILECPFKHPKLRAKGPSSGLVVGDGMVNPEDANLGESTSCSAYDRGFCKLGPLCPKPHIRRRMCLRFLTGFCPYGPDCEDAHPKFSQIDDSMRIARSQPTQAPYILKMQREREQREKEQREREQRESGQVVA